jgi:hypothetical protein
MRIRQFKKKLKYGYVNRKYELVFNLQQKHHNKSLKSNKLGVITTERNLNTQILSYYHILLSYYISERHKFHSMEYHKYSMRTEYVFGTSLFYKYQYFRADMC